MDTTIKNKIIDALEEYMTTHGLSQNDVEKHTGVNASYLIEMRKRNTIIARRTKQGVKEIAIADKYYELIAGFIGMEIRKTYWKIRPTPQFIEAMAILEDAKKYGYTNTIIGETGSGKTTALEVFAQRNPNDVFVVTVSRLDNIGDLLDKVIELLRIPPAKTKSRKLRDISKKMISLKMDGFTPMLAFDEVEFMSQPALCAMKEFYDNLSHKCSIILSGHPQFVRTLEKLKNKEKDGMPQLYRRIKFGIRYLPKIDRKYDQFLEEIEDKNLKKFLRTECDNYGELHDVLVPAMREADRMGEELSENFVRTIFNYHPSVRIY